MVRKEIVIVIFVAALLLCAGCSNNQARLFNPSMVPKEVAVTVVTAVKQDTLELRQQPNYAAGAFVAGGPLAVTATWLIQSAADVPPELKSEDHLDSILSSIDVRPDLERKIELGISQLEWAHEIKIDRKYSEGMFALKKYSSEMNEGLLLYIDTQYYLSPRVEVLEVRADYALYDPKLIGRTSDGWERRIPIYKNSAVIQSFPHNGSLRVLLPEEKKREVEEFEQKYPTDFGLNSTVKENKKKLGKFIKALDQRLLLSEDYDPEARVWLSNDGRLIRKELAITSDLLVDTIVGDLSGRFATKLDGDVTSSGEVGRVRVLSRNSDGRILMQLEDGTLLSKQEKVPLYLPWGGARVIEVDRAGS